MPWTVRMQTSQSVDSQGALVQLVRQAIRIGKLKSGDQLPTVREVVAKMAINPNTVPKAYRELDRDSLAAAPTDPAPMRIAG
jgi:GntR family transcriptional regulator